MNPTTKIILIGGGKHASIVFDIAQLNGYNVVGFVDDTITNEVHPEMGVPWLGTVTEFVSLLDKYIENGLVCCIGDNESRKKIVETINLCLPVSWITLVHPFSCVSSRARLGDGTVVCAGAIVQPEAQVGQHVILNTGSSVDHHCHVDDYVHIGPGVRLCGCVTVGYSSLVGAGSTVLPLMKIGTHAIVGAHSVVLQEVEDGEILYGKKGKMNA